MNIPPPSRPRKPILEEVSVLPDKPHKLKGYDGVDPHCGPTCTECGFWDCQHCNPDMFKDKSCLRLQAEERNNIKESRYNNSMEKYKSQKEYFNRIKKELE